MSSFKLHKETSNLIIRNEKEWNNRLNELKKHIDYWLVNNPTNTITNKYLFYDTK